MKFLSLHLQKFGPFSDRTIELSAPGGPGLVVLYGPNEAGKSSALRAIRDLLYGIPVRTRDDFIHKKTDLRVGARLLFSDGEELAVLRRKGNKNTLRSLDDREAIEAPRLKALVEAVPEAHFENFYGLDHHQLVVGSAALLKDEGDLGRVLFGAGLGSVRFREVLEGLEREAAALFSPRGSKPSVNQAIAEWKSLKKQIDQESLRPGDWEVRRSQLQADEERLLELSRELEEKRAQLARLERIQRALPVLGKRAHAAEQIAAAGEVLALRDDFEERLRAARTDRDQARLIAERARQTLEKEGQKRADLPEASPLLAEASRVDQLHEELGSYKDLRRDLPKRIAELEALEETINTIFASLGTENSPAQLEAFRRGQSAATRINTLVSDSDRLQGSLDQLDRELEEAAHAEERMAAQEAEAGDEPETGPLERSLARLIKLGDLDERIEKQAQNVAQLRAEAVREMEQLGFRVAGGDGSAGDGELKRLGGLCVPPMETLEVFVAKGEAHAQRRARAQETLRELADELAEVDERLARRLDSGEVPSEASLERARAQRDAAWQGLREARRGRGGEPLDGLAWEAQAEAFESEMRSADGLADRLRWDADRVAQQAADRARRERLAGSIENAEEEGAATEQERAALVAEWQEVWRPVGIDPPRSEAAPRWRRDFDRLLERSAQLAEGQAELDRDEARRRSARSELIEVLAAVDPERAEAESGADGRLDRLLELAEERCAALRAVADRRLRRREEWAAARERRAESMRERDRLTAERERWRSDWREAVAGLAPDEDPPTYAMTERLGAIGRLLSAVEGREKAAARVAAIQDRVEDFERSVQDGLVAGAADKAKLDPEAAVAAAHREVQEARRTEAVRAKIDEQIEEAQAEGDRARLALDQGAGVLAALQTEAGGVQAEAELDGVLATWKHIKEQKEKKADAEELLASLSDGKGLDELQRESEGVDPDALAAQIAALKSVCDQKDNEREALGADIKVEHEGQKRSFGGARVAAISESAEAQLAVIRRGAGRYLELRLAQKILEREIEAYRAENQGPVLRRAAEYFSALTRGQYPELRSELDDNDAARLVAVRGAGMEAEAVAIEGLSSGTRDQLFLALRLASLEESLGRAEAMPLIADDVLVEFDEERSRAGLECLAQLGEKTQILLFTHHAYLAEQARDLGDRAIVHEL